MFSYGLIWRARSTALQWSQKITATERRSTDVSKPPPSPRAFQSAIGTSYHQLVRVLIKWRGDCMSPVARLGGGGARRRKRREGGGGQGEEGSARVAFSWVYCMRAWVWRVQWAVRVSAPVEYLGDAAVRDPQLPADLARPRAPQREPQDRVPQVVRQRAPVRELAPVLVHVATACTHTHTHRSTSSITPQLISLCPWHGIKRDCSQFGSHSNILKLLYFQWCAAFHDCELITVQ